MNNQDLQKIDALLQKMKKDLKKDLEEKIDEAVMHIVQVVDKNKADKRQVNQIEKRVEKIEEELHLTNY